MREGEFLRRAFHVRTQFLDILLELFVAAVQPLVVVEVVVFDLRVLLPCVGLRPSHNNLKTVVLQRACPVTRQTAFGNQRLDSLLRLLAKGFYLLFTLVHAQHRTEHTVDDIIPIGILICLHNAKCFVRRLVCEWPLIARASHTPLPRVNN